MFLEEIDGTGEERLEGELRVKSRKLKGNEAAYACAGSGIGVGGRPRKAVATKSS
jgi:hypothetical protein